jgi:hypothetical protein
MPPEKRIRLSERQVEAVLRQTLRELGYSETDIVKIQGVFKRVLFNALNQ